MGNLIKPDVVLHTLDIGNLIKLLNVDGLVVDAFINKALDEYQLCEVISERSLTQKPINVSNPNEAHAEFYKQILEVVGSRYNSTSKYSRYPQVSHLRRNQHLFIIVKFY